MSKSGSAFELPNVTFEDTAGDTAKAAKSNLSNFAIDSMKSGHTGANSIEGAAKAATSGVNGQLENGSSVSEQMEQAAKAAGKAGNDYQNSKLDHGAAQIGEGIADKLSGEFSKKMERSLKPFVTDQDRKNAKEMMAKELSPLLPEADKKALTDLQGALIDGDVNKLTESLKALSGDPEKLSKYIDQLNKQFNKHETRGGLELSMDSKGNVLVYENHGNTAVSIDPKSGETTLRGIDRQPDGSVVLKEGEIINRKAEDVMKRIGDSATRSISVGLDRIPFHPVPRGLDKITEMPHILRPNTAQEQFKAKEN
ncbi:hypothetical protein KF707_00145 [Candidatus Obscuribacterales bacterium]|nr:hypothetical protein [Candidatus Obscuribacterales bacterium]MBX3150005.1 hypothetical protein [Candidatus Obscuribacterales bacterium]